MRDMINSDYLTRYFCDWCFNYDEWNYECNAGDRGDDLNFFKSQHNLGVTHGQYGINYRIYFDDNASEVEFKYKPIKNLQAHIKIAEDDLLQENRYRLTHTIGKYFDTKFSHRIEF